MHARAYRLSSAALPLLMLLSLLLIAPPAHGQAIVVVEQDREQPLEVQRRQVDVQIDGQVATTRLEQVIYNPTSQRREATLLLPLPQGAHVRDFKMDVNGEPVEAELLSADEARQIYEDIVRRQRDPALLEYMGQDLLKARIFPIEPRSEQRIELTYTHLLPVEGGLTSYTFPLRACTAGGLTGGDFAMRIDIVGDTELGTVYSPTHKVEIDRDGRRATVGLETGDETAQSRNFELYFAATPDDAPADLRLLTYRDGEDPTGREEGFFLLLATPRAIDDDIASLPKDIVFVLDTSGSMAGDKLEQAKRALRFCLANLNNDDRFDVVRFSTAAEPVFGQLVSATDEHRDEAEDFVKQLKPLGGTAIHDALLQSLATFEEADSADRPRFVVFLTDGQPTVDVTAEEQIVDAVDSKVDDVRVFCFGIGTDVNTHLLDKITEATRAASEYVLPEEDIELKVSRFYGKIDQPVLTNLKLRSLGDDVRLMDLQPGDLPDLFAGEQLVVFGRYRGTGEATIVLEGDSLNGATVLERRVDLPAKASEHDFIPRLWAMRRVGMLLDALRLRGDNDELRQEVVQLARAYNIVTPYTAYLIVEDEGRRNVPLAMQTLPAVRQDAALREQTQRQLADMEQDKVGYEAMAASGAQAQLRGASAAPSADLGAITVARPGELAAPQAKQATQYIAGRTFVQQADGQWVDTAAQHLRNVEPVRVAMGSPEYFELLRKDPSAAEWLAVGPQVQVVIDGTLYQVE